MFENTLFHILPPSLEGLLQQSVRLLSGSQVFPLPLHPCKFRKVLQNHQVVLKFPVLVLHKLHLPEVWQGRAGRAGSGRKRSLQVFPLPPFAAARLTHRPAPCWQAHLMRPAGADTHKPLSAPHGHPGALRGDPQKSSEEERSVAYRTPPTLLVHKTAAI